MARSPDRRDSNRYPRERRDDRGYRRRSRSRGEVQQPATYHRTGFLTGQQRRYDDHDRDNHRRRDRSYDRHADAKHDDRHGGRRNRSRDRSLERNRDRDRDRKRSREASPVRNRKDERERYRDPRDYYDDRDRKRPRRGDSPRLGVASHGSRRDDGNKTPRSMGARSENSPSYRSVRDNTPSQADPEEDEAAKKAARLAKVAAMKLQMAQKSGGGATTVSNGKSSKYASPAVESPGPLASSSSPPPTIASSLASNVKFRLDPKEITKKAAAAMAKHKTLGSDVYVPNSARTSTVTPGESEKSGAQGLNKGTIPAIDGNSKARLSNLTGPGELSARPTKITGIGLNKSGLGKSEKPITKRVVELDDEEDFTHRKLEKLPELNPIDVAGDSTLANDADGAKAATNAPKIGSTIPAVKVLQTRTNNGRPAQTTTDAADITMEDEIDPLDAFMDTLEKPSDQPDTLRTVRKESKKEPQLFDADDDYAIDAVGDKSDEFAEMMMKKRKKEIPLVDHSKVEYEDFRKNFYFESIEISEMSDDEVMLLRAELDNIKVRGLNPPKPILAFPQGGFGTQVLDVLRNLKFEKPTSIQAQALPAIMSGRDTIGVAKTGSGKTMAFILPMFRHIKDQRPIENLEGPIGLILAPTRELAVQIHRDCKPFLKALDLRAVCAYGGSPIKDQIAELKRGAEIVVATPGRIIDLLAANSGRVTNLSRVTYLVLDEADRMFDMGFEPQITRMLNNIRPGRQTVLFSATFPRNMEALARKALTKPIEIIVGGRSVVAPEIEQIVEVRDQSTKFNRLLELLGKNHSEDDDSRSLVFVEKQETADTLFKELTKKGYPVVSIHGGRDQIDRDQSITDFKAGNIPVMVATSVAARGLDVKQLTLVVNFDCPNHNEDYVHRCGRTGRAGNKGVAVTFVTPEQGRYAHFLVKALDDSKQAVPEDLAELATSFQQKVDAGEAKKAGGGFGGRGIERLEEAREADRAREKKHYKTGDEPEEEEDAPAKKKTKVNENEADKLVAAATAGVMPRDTAPEPEADQAIMPSELAQHLRNAMNVLKTASPPPTSAGAGAGPPKSNPLDKVNAAVANINSRIGAKGATRPGVPVDNRGPDAGAYHAHLIINDFPQKARWAVTNRTNVAKILEATGTSITSKGNFYPKGKDPEAGGQPKLYILVEGDTEIAVEDAMRELTRLLREGTIAAMESDARAPAAGGRYSVI